MARHRPADPSQPDLFSAPVPFVAPAPRAHKAPRPATLPLRVPKAPSLPPKRAPEYDAQESAHLADVGIALAVGKSTPEWRELALHALRRTAEAMPDFTADDFWPVLEESLDCNPEVPRAAKDAVGAIFRRAAGLGLIEKTALSRLSSRRLAHSKPLPVWRSKIHGLS